MLAEQDALSRFMDAAAEFAIAVKKGETDKMKAQAAVVFVAMSMGMGPTDILRHGKLIANSLDVEMIQKGQVHALIVEMGRFSERVNRATLPPCKIRSIEATLDKLAAALAEDDKKQNGGTQ